MNLITKTSPVCVAKMQKLLVGKAKAREIKCEEIEKLIFIFMCREG